MMPSVYLAEWSDLEPRLRHPVLVLGYGTGDTFNSLLHLRFYPPSSSYELIVKKDQAALVTSLTKWFEAPPDRIWVLDHWGHDFSERVFVSLGQSVMTRGVVRDFTAGLLAYWASPSQYQVILPLNAAQFSIWERNLADAPVSISPPEGSTILFTSTSGGISNFHLDWNQVCASLIKRSGRPVFANVSPQGQYKDLVPKGSTPISPSQLELVTLLINRPDLSFVALRSGVVDLLRLGRNKGLVIYSELVKDLFTTCRMSALHHNLDLHELVIRSGGEDWEFRSLEYVLENFLLSPVRKA